MTTEQDHLEGLSKDYRAACNRHQNNWENFLKPVKSLGNHLMGKFLERRHPGTLLSMPSKPFGQPCEFLKPNSHLKTKLFGWPDLDFSPENSVLGKYGTEPWLSLLAGDEAIDFTLKDEYGTQHSLREKLLEKPVILTFGMYTCPAYQMSKKAEIDMVNMFHEKIHFIHLYTLEPHPKGSNSPDSGKPWELMYSKFPQRTTYSERQTQSLTILKDHPSCQIILIDDLNEVGMINPVWSTYGPAPRPAFLIRQDGLIDTSQLWFNSIHLEKAIQRLLNP